MSVLLHDIMAPRVTGSSLRLTTQKYHALFRVELSLGDVFFPQWPSEWSGRSLLKYLVVPLFSFHSKKRRL